MKKQPEASTAAQAQERECHVWLEQGPEHSSFALASAPRLRGHPRALCSAAKAMQGLFHTSQPFYLGFCEFISPAIYY